MIIQLNRFKITIEGEAGDGQRLLESVVVTPSVSDSADREDGGELVAVITAAIAECCGEGARVTGFVPVQEPAQIQTAVIPMRERRRASLWRTTGRAENCEGFGD